MHAAVRRRAAQGRARTDGARFLELRARAQPQGAGDVPQAPPCGRAVAAAGDAGGNVSSFDARDIYDLSKEETMNSKITRRTMLAAGVSMAAGPTLAAECPIGPPPHQKGPLVWMDMDQVELDAAYDQSFYAPLARQIR